MVEEIQTVPHFMEQNAKKEKKKEQEIVKLLQNRQQTHKLTSKNLLTCEL